MSKIDPQLVLYGAIALAVLFVVYKIFGKSKDEIADDKRQEQLEAATREEANKLANKGIKPSWPDSKYLTAANTIHSAMKGLGTDESTLVRAFAQTVLNAADFLKLDAAFGVRDNDTMSKWINNEDAGVWNVLNQHLRNRGIIYQL